MFDMKALTNEQYEECRASAIQRIRARAGARPERKQFQRELGSLWTPLDALALIVFAAALVISSAHIIKHMGDLAASTYAASAAGIVLDRDTYTRIHQITMIALSEASALLFMVMHGMSKRRVSVPLLLAIIAAVFIFVANVQSGIGLLESVMPPIFTLGIGLHLERLIVKTIDRRADVDTRYIAAIAAFDAATNEPTAHPEFVKMFRQELWQRLMGLTANRDFKDAPPGVRHWAVAREMERDAWAAADHIPAPVEWQPDRPTEAPAPKAARRAQRPSGLSLPEPDGLAAMPATPNGNGHIAAAVE